MLISVYRSVRRYSALQPLVRKMAQIDIDTVDIDQTFEPRYVLYTHILSFKIKKKKQYFRLVEYCLIGNEEDAVCVSN